MTNRPDRSLEHLLGRLAVVEDRAKALVSERRRTDPEPDDRFRGLFISDDRLDHLLSSGSRSPPDPVPEADALLEIVERRGDETETSGEVIRLRALARHAALTPIDTELLLVALAPDVDPRMERVYGYLNDDVTRRRASVSLALELTGERMTVASARARLAPGCPLIDCGLVVIEDQDRPFLGRALRVPDRVTAHLLGDDAIDQALAAFVLPACPAVGHDDGLARALREGVHLVYIRDRAGAAPRGLAAAALTELDVPVLDIDLSRMAGDEAPSELARLVARESMLAGAAVVAGPVEDLAVRGASATRSFTSIPGCVILFGTASWDPAWSAQIPFVVDAPPTTREQRSSMWNVSLDGEGPGDLDAAEAMAPFRLAPEQVVRAARSAVLSARHTESPLSPALLRAGARAQNASGLERLTRRIEPTVGWPDLVISSATRSELQDLSARARRRDLVLDEWAMRRGGGRGRGVTALFAGDSGTGKTMSAEVLAHELGFDLYAVDLATVIDKYVGETEKNLERIFSEADGVNAVLLFDEADALFGKRSEVRDAHDRYANVEVAFLLQRMESFNGLAILATNLKANVDEAFARRLDVIVDFPMPTEGDRRRLWDVCLGPLVPRADDLDLDFCARSFELSGGNIHSIALSAAYLAAEAGRTLGMPEIIKSIYREYRKLGRLCVPAEFGPWFELVTQAEDDTHAYP